MTAPSESRQALEASLRRVLGPTAGSEGSESRLAGPSGALAILGVVVAFFWGRRRGRRR